MLKKRKKLEYRYYKMPTDSYVLPLLGRGWEQEYGVEYSREYLHFHNYMEVGYCYHGDGELMIEDRSYEYKGEMFSVIPANIPHITKSSPGNICKWEFLFIDIESFIKNEIHADEFKKARMLEVLNRRGMLRETARHENLARLVLAIIRECREQEQYYKECVTGYLHAFVAEVLRLEDELERSRQTRRVNEYIRNALEYINQHYMEQIRIEDIAAASGLSESHFRRMFEEVMSMKPLDYVNMIRIYKACVLIGKEDSSMEKISYQVGFQTQSTFNRNFKKVTGTSPYQWKTKEKTYEGMMKNYQISALAGWEA